VTACSDRKIAQVLFMRSGNMRMIENKVVRILTLVVIVGSPTSTRDKTKVINK